MQNVLNAKRMATMASAHGAHAPAATAGRMTNMLTHQRQRLDETEGERVDDAHGLKLEHDLLQRGALRTHMGGTCE